MYGLSSPRNTLNNNSTNKKYGREKVLNLHKLKMAAQTYDNVFIVV